MPHAVKVEVSDTELADPLALVAQCGRLDVFPVCLCADNFDARARSGIPLLQGYNLFDVPSLIVFCRDNVIIKVILSIVELILRLLALPALQEGEDNLRIEGKRPTAAVSLEIAHIMQTNLSTHSKPLYLLCDGNRHALHIAVVP